MGHTHDRSVGHSSGKKRRRGHGLGLSLSLFLSLDLGPVHSLVRLGENGGEVSDEPVCLSPFAP